MGPPRERGGEQQITQPEAWKLIWLQWGRLANEAERRMRGQREPEAQHASIGPPRERGGERGRMDVRRARRVRASMGPPRERGGEGTRRSSSKSLIGCFNGAASRTRRRGRVPCSPTRWPYSFNGAASRTRRRGPPWNLPKSKGFLARKSRKAFADMSHGIHVQRLFDSQTAFPVGIAPRELHFARKTGVHHAESPRDFFHPTMAALLQSHAKSARPRNPSYPRSLRAPWPLVSRPAVTPRSNVSEPPE
jgi:hypothetical protein